MIRKYKTSDYEMIASWWKKRDLPVPSASVLPKNGYIISDKIAMFICQTDSKFAILEFYVSDPDTSKAQRKSLTDLLLQYVEQECKNLGYVHIYNFLEHPGSCSSLERNNYKLNSKTVKFYSKELT